MIGVKGNTMSKSIEEELRNERYWRIGWSIMHMNWFERFWWGLTGIHKYMTHEYWEHPPKAECAERGEG